MDKESRSRLQTRPLKRPFNQVVRGPPARASPTPPSRHSFSSSPPSIVCRFCQRPGHSRGNCRWANGQYLASGSRGHQLANFPSKGQRSIMPTPPTSDAARRNPVPAEEELHFLHSDRCSLMPREGQELNVEETRLST